MCGNKPGEPSITTITLKTSSCSGCSSGNVEQGLMLHLEGRGSGQCDTDSLDNMDKHDYGAGSTAQFDSTFLNDPPSNDDHGLGQCNNVSNDY